MPFQRIFCAICRHMTHQWPRQRSKLNRSLSRSCVIPNWRRRHWTICSLTSKNCWNLPGMKFKHIELLRNAVSIFAWFIRRLFNISVQELSSLDSSYREMFKMLHVNKLRSVRKEIRCASKLSTNICRGSNYVTIDVRNDTPSFVDNWK